MAPPQEFGPCWLIRANARGGSGLALFFGVGLERGEHDGFGEQLGQDVRRGLRISRIDDVCWHTLTVYGGQLPGDLGVVLGPVGFEQSDFVVGELTLDLVRAEDSALIDLAAEAPGGGEVDED